MLGSGCRPATLRLSDEPETAALLAEAADRRTGRGAPGFIIIWPRPIWAGAE